MTTCAVVIPRFSVEEAYTIEEKSSIFTAKDEAFSKPWN
jgi:hypothetical protein